MTRVVVPFTQLHSMADETIDLALAAVPETWTTAGERTALATYLATRRDVMLAPIRNLSDGALFRRYGPQILAEGNGGADQVTRRRVSDSGSTLNLY